MTPKQRRFVEEYLMDLNATQAAIRAGYAAKWANTTGSRLLKRPEIRRAVGEAVRAQDDQLGASAERILKEYARIAFASVGEFLHWGPEVVTLKDKILLSQDQQAAVAEIVQSQTRTGKTVRLKLYDKQAALDRLVRYLGLFKDTPAAQEDNEYAEMTDTERVQRVLALFERARKEREAAAAEGADKENSAAQPNR